MSTFAIFMSQFTISLLAIALLAKGYLWPWLQTQSYTQALMPLLFIHTFRTVALGVLIPALVDPEFPPSIAATIGYGDLTSSILALLTLTALVMKSRIVLPLAWLFSIVGSIDVIGATLIGAQNEMYSFDLGPQWYVPTFYVPLLMVTHVLIVLLLLKKQVD